MLHFREGQRLHHQQRLPPEPDERDGAGAVYDAAGLFSGMTAEEYQELAKLVKSQKAGEETGAEKKQAVLQALMDRGLRQPGGGRLEGSGII